MSIYFFSDFNCDGEASGDTEGSGIEYPTITSVMVKPDLVSVPVENVIEPETVQILKIPTSSASTTQRITSNIPGSTVTLGTKLARHPNRNYESSSDSSYLQIYIILLTIVILA